MEEKELQPYEDWNYTPLPPYPTAGKEIKYAGWILILSVFLADFVIMGGFNLGFGIMAALIIVATAVYLLGRGCTMKPYTAALLALSLIICGSFARSDDQFMKFVMFCFLTLSANLGLCLLAGQNRRSPKGLCSLLDIPRTVFMLGLGRLSPAFRGMWESRKTMGAAGKKRSAVLAGLAVAVPIVAVLIPLLMRADAAFEGLIDQMPEIAWPEILAALGLGTLAAVFFYTRAVALALEPREEKPAKQRKGLHPLTVNTALGAVCLVYGAYLFSQLAYFSGGFSGILPTEYTMAEYARRGFFEMAWLCAINLGIIALAVGLVEKKGLSAPLSTRLLCLFVGLVTLFFVSAASAKMFLYISGYGLTRLRVLTEVIMVFMGLAVIFVLIWLFLPRLPYMKVILLTALVMGAAVAWADVDTVVASYNVSAFQQGKLDTIDVPYLAGLSDGAMPYLEKLTHSDDPILVQVAMDALENHGYTQCEDFRGFTVTVALTKEIRKMNKMYSGGAPVG